MGHFPSGTTDVRVDHASGHMERYVGRIGRITGLNGQFVLVSFEGEGHDHAFLPGELKTF